MYKLDKSKAVELDISNDAFYLFTEDDEPIDESCYDEINNLYAKYESFDKSLSKSVKILDIL